MSLRLNSEVPDFSAETTQGNVNFHNWIGDGWAILFSHPKDFTPVCTTELGYMARLMPEFQRRNCKIIGLSVDPVDDHSRWARDIEETQGHAVTYPLIGDPQLNVAKLYDMLPEGAGDTSAGRTPGRQRNGTICVRDRTRQKSQSDAHLPHDERSQFRRGAAAPRFLPAHRQTSGRYPG